MADLIEPTETEARTVPDRFRELPDPIPLEDTVAEYLGAHNPFPDDTLVDVLDRDGHGWTRARVVERTATDEWTVEFDDGERVWRDHHELRPADAVA